MLLNLRVSRVKQMSNNFYEIERKLLPLGHQFSEDQRKVIEARGNINVVAGPGSGKTTVLTAKLLSLLTNQKQGDKGICCITHTNVAVDEIRKKLLHCGIKNINYPNFIGTIQSFFDYYFGSKAFGIIFPDKRLRIFDGNQYQTIYNQEFINETPWWSYDTAPDYKRRNAHLVISDDRLVSFKNDEAKAYSNNINKALKNIISRGIINNDQMTVLAKWYVNSHNNLLSAAIEKRFKYILLDEAQDTNNQQYQLLMNLLENTEVYFQRFGDPYQALYTIYGNETKDAWLPKHEEQKGIAQVKEISTTVRFDQRIANLVKNVCYEEYSTFHSERCDNKFDNYFITFRNESDLMAKYNRLIEQCATNDSDFFGCANKDMIVAPQHKDLEKWFSGYDRSTQSISNNSTNPFKELLTVVTRKLARENFITVTEERKKIQSDLKYSIAISEIIKELFSNNPDIEILKQCMNAFSLKKTSQQMIDELFKEKEISLCDLSNGGTSENDKLGVSTIHGVKGETHRSTFLLIDSKVNSNFSFTSPNPFWEKIFPFLIGKRIDYSHDNDAKFTRYCLKYAYVALSRPIFFAGVAVPIANLKSNQKDKMLSYGWKEAK